MSTSHRRTLGPHQLRKVLARFYGALKVHVPILDGCPFILCVLYTDQESPDDQMKEGERKAYPMNLWKAVIIRGVVIENRNILPGRRNTSLRYNPSLNSHDSISLAV